MPEVCPDAVGMGEVDGQGEGEGEGQGEGEGEEVGTLGEADALILSKPAREFPSGRRQNCNLTTS
jgi:hypothetical protein